MNEKNEFALVPRPSCALEKAEPGANRVLPGMVSDTLALAKKGAKSQVRPLRIVMVNDEPGVLQIFDIAIRAWFKDVTMLLFSRGATALGELAQTDPDLLITDDRMPVMSGGELCRRLLDRKVTYPIIVVSSLGLSEQWVREFANRGLNVSLLDGPPFDLESFLKALETALKIKIPRDTANTLAPARAGQPDKVVRTVLVGDEDGFFASLWLEILPTLKEFEPFDFRPINFKSASDLLTATERQPFDLIVINFTRVRWDIGKGENIGSRLQKNNVNAFDDVASFLAELKSKHDKPIIIFSTLEETRLSAKFAQVGVSYFQMLPPSLELFISAFQTALKIPRTIARSDAETPPVVADTKLENVFQTGLPETRARNEDSEAIYKKFRTNHALHKYDYARSLLRKAAEMGHTEAMYDCGMDFQSGDGFPMDRENAFYWLKKAAERGHADAQFWIGTYYMSGDSFLPQNLSEAYKWLKLATDHQNKDMFWAEKHAAHMSASLSAKMTSEQLQEGERRYREFKAHR
jgi:DNA-binding NarL/FixJ family response regulator